MGQIELRDSRVHGEQLGQLGRIEGELFNLFIAGAIDYFELIVGGQIKLREAIICYQ